MAADPTTRRCQVCPGVEWWSTDTACWCCGREGVPVAARRRGLLGLIDTRS